MHTTAPLTLRRVDPHDPAAVNEHVAVANEVAAADSPWMPPTTPAETRGDLLHGWDGDPFTAWLAEVDGTVVGVGEFGVTRWDNHHLGLVSVQVRPSCRRQGHGSALLEQMVARAREDGRTTVLVEAFDLPAVRSFGTRHGFEVAAADVCRHQFPAELDRDALAALRRAAEPHAADYEVVRRLGASREDELAAIATMSEAINDAPIDDLDVEDEVYSPERVSAYEEAQLAQGRLLHRVFARHRVTGELAGHTVVVVSGERPQLAWQHDTSVVRAHRGHRLGLLLKLDMLEWLAETQPQVRSIETWNAESNDHMIGVNEALGYRVMARAFELQRRL
jgi:GNAT superfamily N-acetyltransferase